MKKIPELTPEFKENISILARAYAKSAGFIEHTSEFDCICRSFKEGVKYGYTQKDLNSNQTPASDFMPDNREIEGYVWKEGYKEKYVVAAAVLVRWHHDPQDIEIFKDNSEWCIKLREAGVLDLWFEPKYKEVKNFPKEGTPCLVWSNENNVLMDEIFVRISNGNGTFTAHGWDEEVKHDNFIELTTEQIAQLPFNK